MVTDVVTLASSLFGDQRMETVFPIQHPPGLVNKCDSSGLNHKPLPGQSVWPEERDPGWPDLGGMYIPEVREREVLFSRCPWFGVGQVATVTRGNGKG